MQADLQCYLERIHFHATPKVDLETLQTLQHQHLLHIPYENLDVQLGRPLDFDIDRIFQKIVLNQRGGWCYEMNGLLGWALQQIGFQVTRMSGAVMRESQGDINLGNHLILEVQLDEPYLADVGLGDGLREPIPIRAGEHIQAGMHYHLEPIEDGFWRFHNQPLSNVSSFDFRHEPAAEKELADKCQWLQTSPDSPFTSMFIAQRFTPDSIAVQLGKIFTRLTREGKTSIEIADIDTFHQHMAETFGLEEDFTTLWPEILKAHERFVDQRQPTD